MADHSPEPLGWTWLGTVPYGEAVELQGALVERRRAGEIGDVLLLLEHPPVLTKGRRTDPRELGMGEDWYRMQGIEVAETDRGGKVTYHGPGQLVAYPIVDIAGVSADGRPDVHAYVRALENVMTGALAHHGVPAQVFDGLTGVWTAGAPPIPVGVVGPQGTEVGARDPRLAAEPGDARKIGSIGIHVSRGIASHGLAINVNNDLQPFEWIVPCGVESARMTSLSRELGAEQDLEGFAATVRERFGAEFGRDLVPAPAPVSSVS
ncbi:MAG: lipoyl(octanoyl) transferase LipB [Solirubrobacterales bacterium]